MEVPILRISMRKLLLLLTILLITFNNVTNSTTCIKVHHLESIRLGGGEIRELSMSKCVSISAAYVIKSEIVSDTNTPPRFIKEELCCCEATDYIERRKQIGDEHVNYKEITSCGCGKCESY